MNRRRTFRAVIEDAGRGGAFVAIPFDVETVYGKKRVPVRATLGGEPYRGSLVRMGEGYMLGVRKDIRDRIGKSIGDTIEVVLEEDTEPRVVDVPGDLTAALESAPKAKEIFGGLSYTHQKEYVQWIEEAKREATRQTRIEKTVAMLLDGKKGR
ncbi:MAG: YdeI/OmpD-associated family protein [Candidatus Eisenbacteria bacterium]